MNVRVGWVSGTSRLGDPTLSPEQRAFVDALPAPPRAKLWTNFPYTLDGSAPFAFRETPLVLASVVNAVRFGLACQPLRRPARLRAWRQLKASCDRLLLVTGSCGSQIVAALERAAPEGARVELLSFGPVDRGRPRLPQLRVVGSRDRLARRADVTLPGVGHMDYLVSPEAHRIAHDWLRERLGVRA